MENKKLHYLMGTNMIAYIKSKGIIEDSIEFTSDSKVKYWFEDNENLYQIIREFKENKLIQEFVNQQNIVKQTIIKLRNANKSS